MDSLLQSVLSTASPFQVIGVYTDQRDAQVAADKALAWPGLSASQVHLLAPQEADSALCAVLGTPIPPEQDGLSHPFLSSRAVAGLAGAIAGLVLFLWLMNSGHALVVRSPWLAALALIALGGAFGLLLGRAMSLRADHLQRIARVRSALADNCWVLVLHPSSAEQVLALKDFLTASGAQILHTP